LALNDTLEGVVHGFAAGAGVSFGYRRNRENAVSARTVSDTAYLAGPTNPALALGTRAYAANAMNQYTSVAGTAYSYDLDGNLTGDGVWSCGHDAQGRLVSATRPGTSISLGYDAVGRRRSRAVNGVATAFLSSGDQEVAEYDGAGALMRRFVWGPAGPDDIIAVIGVTGSVTDRRRFHHADGLGSTVALSDAAGVVLERYAYTPFGVGESNTGSTPWRFTGRRLDAETGLYHLRARDYAPLLGRFIQPDPIGMLGGINLYAYVENDPLNYTDPQGLVAPLLLAALWWTAGGALIGGGVDAAIQGTLIGSVDYRQVAVAAVGGALTGGAGSAISGAIVGAGSRALANAAIGAAANAGQTALLNYARGTSDDLVRSAIIGGAFGAAGSGLGDAVSSYAAQRSQAAFNSLSLQQRLLANNLSQTNNLPLTGASPSAVILGNILSNVVGSSSGIIPSDFPQSLVGQANASTLSANRRK